MAPLSTPQIHNYSHSGGVIHEGFAFSFGLNSKIQHCSVSPPFLYTWYSVHVCGVRVVILEHGALGICKSFSFAPKIVNLSVFFIPILLYFFLVSEGSGRRKPPAERSTLYFHTINSLLLYTTKVAAEEVERRGLEAMIRTCACITRIIAGRISQCSRGSPIRRWCALGNVTAL